MARKKVVLVLVEGITDKISLELLLVELMQNNHQVIFEVVHGDITSDFNVSKSNLKSKLANIVNGAGKRKFTPSDYKEIIHLVDMDGAFLGESSIHQRDSEEGILYTENGIYTDHPERVKQRNKHKQDILNMLCTTRTILRSVPYRVFYFSSNLEHVLHNRIDMPDDLKMKHADNFLDLYIKDLAGFVRFICESPFSVKLDYQASWAFIRQDDNSIKRYSNFNLVLNDYVS